MNTEINTAARKMKLWVAIANRIEIAFFILAAAFAVASIARCL